ncbi:MAG: phage baseplate protein [Acidobacteriota bacterium]
MRALSARDVIELWETTVTAGPTERALAILGRAWPEIPSESLGAYPLGYRDGLLLELYRRTFGPELDLFVSCPCCGEGLELEVTADDLLARIPERTGDASFPDAVHELAVDEVTVCFRLPSSFDVMAAAEAPDHASARSLLLERVVVEAHRDGEEIVATELDETTQGRLATSLTSADPGAELIFDLACEACEHSWQALCDVIECFSYRLMVTARHLLREVHTLARGYGWREVDILALSAPRRRVYLEMLARD